MTRLLLLVPTSSYRVDDFLEAASKTGAQVVVGAGESDGAPSPGTLAVDFANHNRGLDQIVAFAAEKPLNAIVAVDEGPTLLAARACAALGLPHNSPDSVAIAGNKRRLREVLTEAGLPQPRFEPVPIDAPSPTRIRFPCVVKPLAMAASRGVIRADSRAAFDEAFARTAAIVRSEDPNLKQPTSRHLLVESYIPGIEMALEGLLVNGDLIPLSLFDKPDPLEGPFFEETIYVTPSTLEPSGQKAVIEAVTRAVAAVGLRSGPIHAEVRLDGDVVYVIEVAARSIGGLCGRTLRFGTGFSLEELIVRHALGEPIETDRQDAAAGVMMIPVPIAGRLNRIEGLMEAHVAPGIEDVRITVPFGDTLVPLPEGDRYLGFIIARGETPAAVEAALRSAHRQLRFEISEPAAARQA